MNISKIKQVLQKWNIDSPARTEEELVLKLDKSEVLDPHTILPHAELNELVYTAVNRFIERYSGNTLKITIVSGTFSPDMQDVIRESYHAHYLDEYVKINKYLNARYIRVVSLIIISLIAFTCGSYISNHFRNVEFIAGAATQLSIFCLWEIGYTHFDRSNASVQKKHILRALNANIQFLGTTSR